MTHHKSKYSKTYKILNTEELWHIIKQKWDSFTKEYSMKLNQGMSKRLLSVIIAQIYGTNTDKNFLFNFLAIKLPKNANI